MTWEDVIARYGLDLTPQHGQWRGPCPLHHGANSTAFAITPEKGFYCFACGKGGGLADFIRLMGDEPDEAARAWQPTQAVEPEEPLVPHELAPLDASHPYFCARGIHAATARYFGAGYYRGPGPMHRRVVIPIHEPDGALAGHVGRTVYDDREPRYLFERRIRRSALLFNLHRVKASGADTVLVTEGVFDAMATYQIGHANVVATLGCQVTENQRALLSRFRRIGILFDEDVAGDDAARELEREFGRVAVRVRLPKTDPASIKGVLLDAAIRSAF